MNFWELLEERGPSAIRQTQEQEASSAIAIINKISEFTHIIRPVFHTSLKDYIDAAKPDKIMWIKEYKDVKFLYVNLTAAGIPSSADTFMSIESYALQSAMKTLADEINCRIYCAEVTRKNKDLIYRMHLRKKDNSMV